ncbi:MAG: YitT family protein [Clostridia bacterium]|nr:YitT family protein [Clostridia bacterium]
MKTEKKAKNGNAVPEPETPVAAEETAATDAAVLPPDLQPAPDGSELPSQPQAKDGKPVVYGDKVLTKSQKQKRTALRWSLMIGGIILMSFSVYFFQTPNEFTLGGMAGLALVLSSFITPAVPFLSYEVILAIINVLLLIIGLIVLGKQCTVKTIFCSLLYTGIIFLFEHFKIISLINEVAGRAGAATLTDQPLLELVYAILLFGIGGALVFNSGASSGGTDIIALILKKYTRLNVGMALMIIDMIIVLISFYTFTVDKGLFSVLGLFTKSFLLDGVIESIGKTKYITVITENVEVISDYILKVINHGYTMYDAEGGYTHNKKKVLVTVCKRNEALKIKMKLHEVDPTAFVIITDANEILGKGFGGTL